MKRNNDTGTTTANKSMGFDPSAIQSCLYNIFTNKIMGGVSKKTRKFWTITDIGGVGWGDFVLQMSRLNRSG